MEIEKYSPKWLLEKLNTSKTDAHKLIHIIKYRKEIVESTEKELILSGVVKWVMIKDEPPPILETVWLSNGKGWTNLGCRVETNEGWHWAVIDGIIYQEKDQIVAECYSDDLDVVYWCKLPKTPCA